MKTVKARERGEAKKKKNYEKPREGGGIGNKRRGPRHQAQKA